MLDEPITPDPSTPLEIVADARNRARAEIQRARIALERADVRPVACTLWASMLRDADGFMHTVAYCANHENGNPQKRPSTARTDSGAYTDTTQALKFECRPVSVANSRYVVAQMEEQK